MMLYCYEVTGNVRLRILGTIYERFYLDPLSSLWWQNAYKGLCRHGTCKISFVLP